jgi:hypothetical protein
VKIGARLTLVTTSFENTLSFRLNDSQLTHGSQVVLNDLEAMAQGNQLGEIEEYIN